MENMGPGPRAKPEPAPRRAPEARALLGEMRCFVRAGLALSVPFSKYSSHSRKSSLVRNLFRKKKSKFIFLA